MWTTEITETGPDFIRVRGYSLADLVSERSFADVVYLLLASELPSAGAARLLDATLVASVDHGMRAPSAGVARIAASAGLEVNNAIASAVNLLGDVHGGAGQQFLEILLDVDRQVRAGGELTEVVERLLVAEKAAGRRIPGFGHPYHPVDPRRAPLIDLAREQVALGEIEGGFLAISDEFERQLGSVPINVDGVTAMVCAELGLTPEMARGIFVIARTAGLLAHAIEERGAVGQLKSLLPTSEPQPFTGVGARPLPGRSSGRNS